MGGIDDERGGKRAGNNEQNMEQNDGRRRTMSAADGEDVEMMMMGAGL